MPEKKGFSRFLKGLTDEQKAPLFSVYKDAVISGTIAHEYDVVYALYGSTKKQKRLTKLRAKNRQVYTKLGLVKRGDKKEIHHIDGNPNNNKTQNLKVVSQCEHKKLHNLPCIKTKPKKKTKKHKH
jgi:hypothetical protein